jgi:hypothetical protein
MMGMALTVPLSAQDPASSVEVSGVWEFSLVDFAWSFEFVVDGHEISGELVIRDFGDFTMDRVELDGDELWVSVSAGGNDLEFVGEVDGDEYRGEMSGFHGEPPIHFVAVRTGS